MELLPASEVLVVGCSSGLEAAFEPVLVEPSGSTRHKLSGSAAARGVFLTVADAGLTAIEQRFFFLRAFCLLALVRH